MKTTFKQFINIKALLILYVCFFISGCEGLTFKKESQSITDQKSYQVAKNKFNEFASEELVKPKRKKTVYEIFWDSPDLILLLLSFIWLPVWILWHVHKNGLSLFGVPLDRKARETQYKEDMEIRKKYRNH